MAKLLQQLGQVSACLFELRLLNELAVVDVLLPVGECDVPLVGTTAVSQRG